MVMIGVFVVQTISPEHALNPLFILHFPYLFLPAMCMAQTWQFTAMINDYYDIEIDRIVHPERPLASGKISAWRYLQLAIMISLISLLLSILLGFLIFILNISFVIAALLYSIPPIRLKNRVFGYICVGWASVVAFLSGVYSPVFWKEGIPWSSPTVSRAIPFYPDLAVISMILFSVLSISPYINAISDYKGDKKGGVKSIYMIYGLERGKKIVSVLILVLFLTPLLLIHSMWDMIIMVSTSFFSVFIFYKFERYQVIFGIYFLVLIYILTRLLGIISFNF
ncbi:MAG: UbiA family prenyltransferase [Candidatus Saliniplasma sp.]